jgi:hypothetical protein
MMSLEIKTTWRTTMRLLMRSQTRVANVTAASAANRRLAPWTSGEERRAWIEALFADHLPRTRAERDRAIEVLAGDGGVWRLLHQVRHSMAETSAAIERLARAALEAEPARAA